MKTITIYRNKDCAKCEKIARLHKALDWLHRVEVSTDTPNTGPLQMSEIVVEFVRRGEIAEGVEALRQSCRNIPAYAILLPPLRLPAIARKADPEVRGCGDGSWQSLKEKLVSEPNARRRPLPRSDARS